jgi:hypothetical protein
MGSLAHANLAAITESPTSISVVETDSRAEVGRVFLEWYAPGDEILSIDLYRRTEGSVWALVAHPTADSRRRITYEDTDVLPGARYGYRLVVRDVYGGEQSAESWVSVPSGDAAPRVLSLQPARPNPFGERVTFRFGLPAAGRVRVAVFDIHGRRVARVMDQVEAAGWREVSWDGRDSAGRPAASGTYFVRLESVTGSQTRKIVLAR